MKANASSCLNTMGKTISHEDGYRICVVLLEETNIELEINRYPDEVDFINVEYYQVDELHATMDEPQPHYANFQLIGVEEPLQLQFHD